MEPPATPTARDEQPRDPARSPRYSGRRRHTRHRSRSAERDRAIAESMGIRVSARNAR